MSLYFLWGSLIFLGFAFGIAVGYVWGESQGVKSGLDIARNVAESLIRDGYKNSRPL